MREIELVRAMFPHVSLKYMNMYVYTLNRVKDGGERYIMQY